MKQYLLTCKENNPNFEEDILDFAKGFNEHYKTDYSIFVHKMTPPINDRFSSFGKKLLYNSKEKLIIDEEQT